MEMAFAKCYNLVNIYKKGGAFMQEIYGQKTDRQLAAKQRIIAVAAGREKADLVLKNAKYLNVFSNEFLCGDIAVANGLIAASENMTVKQRLMSAENSFSRALSTHIFTLKVQW